MLGDPIAHSLSPVLHRAGYAATGLAWEYDAHRVAAGGLAGFVAGLDDGWRGLSLTMPLKREALGLVDDLSATARLAGAANTLVLGDRMVGDNTDVPGAATALSEHGVSAVRSATILGGGATATSVGLALADRGAEVLTLLVRDIDRAAEAVIRLRRHPSTPTVQVLPLGGWEATGDVVVSTIPASAQDDGAGRPVRRRARRLRRRLRPVADPAGGGRRGARTGAGLGSRPAGAPGGPAVRAVHRAAGAGGGHAGRGRAGAQGPGRLMEAVPALVAALVCGLGGLAVPRLIARIPEPDVEPDSESDVEPDTDLDADADPDGPEEDPKEAYVAIAALPGLAWKAALASGVAGGLVAAELGWAWPLVYLLPLVPVCVALAVVDWRTRLLPTWVIRPSYLLVIVGVLVCFAATRDVDDLVRAGWGFLIAFGLYWLLWRVYPRGMGFGDVRLSGVLGIALGQLGWGPLIVGVYSGFLLGGVIGGLCRRCGWSTARAIPSGPSCWSAPWSASSGASRSCRVSSREGPPVRAGPRETLAPMLRWLTAGESHGPSLVAILEGLPAHVRVTTEDIADALARRRLGYGRGARMKFEADEVTLTGGVRHGETQGGPVASPSATPSGPSGSR